jgi:NDP-4-keto-2,6-dideoxyhexose 3-C-methyltransferase
VPKFAQYYEGTGVTFVNGKFDNPTDAKMGYKYKVITAISMFYDLDDPVNFMQTMADNLDKKGIIVISQNYLLSMLQINGFDNIGFEHLCYYSLSGMVKLADKCGLDIFDVQVNDLNGGSFRTYLCHKGDYKIKKSVQKQLDEEKWYGLEGLKCYEDFSGRVRYTIDKIRDFIVISQLSDRKTYIAGASTRGNTLLQACAITPELCPKAIERNPEKYGKKIASCGIPIVSEEEGLADKPDYLLVLPFFFRAEFQKRYAKYIKQGGKLIFPLPRLEIVGK